MTTNVLLKFERFDIYTNSFDHLQLTSLHELYLPITGIVPIFVYEHLYNLKTIKNSTNINQLLLTDIQNTLSLSLSQLCDSLSTLESVGLIQSYIKGSELGEKLIFVLQMPLNYDDFMSNNTLKTLLKNCIDSQKFLNLKYIFNNYLITNNCQNISESIQYIVNKQNTIQNLNNIDFSKVQQKILVKTNKKVVLSENDKVNIEKKYFENNYCIDEIVNIISCHLKKLNDNYFLDILAFNKYFDTESQIEQTNLIVRNHKIFNYKNDLSNFKEVIDSYKSFNAENYYFQITKNNLDIDLQKIINKLKTQLSFNDSIINLLIDYCLFKNIGHISSNYIYKIAKTINNIGLTDIHQIIIYLQCVSNNIKPTYDLLNKSTESIQPMNEQELQDEIWG